MCSKHKQNSFFLKHLAPPAALLIAIVLSAQTRAEEHSAPPDLGRGQTVYEETCVVCHGADGKGEIPGVPDFTKPDGPMKTPDNIHFGHVIDGFESPNSDMAMPPNGGNPDLTEQDVRDVLAYMRDRFGKNIEQQPPNKE